MRIYYLLVCLIIVMAFAQELGKQQVFEYSLPSGDWSASQSDKQTVSRYFVCGAEMNKFGQLQNQPQVCTVHCRRVWSRGKRRCKHQTLCHTPKPIMRYRRSNGVKLQLCHFQKWDDQITLTDHGDGHWQGMKMCPKNYYVSGFQVKISERDGIAALTLVCVNPLLRSEILSVLVMDGDGQWLPSHISDSFASSFRVKRHDGYIAGLEMSFNIFPYIQSFEIKYDLPKDLKSEPQTIETATVVNRGKGNMKKIIQFTRSKEFQRIWQNEKSELHGNTISHMLSRSLKVKNSVSIPFLSRSSTSMSQKEETTTTVTHASAEKFVFGTVEKVLVGQMQRDEIDVAPCIKKTISQIVYSSNVDIPYVAEIGYTNGIAKAVDLIKGYYSGVLTSNVETQIQEEYVC